MVLYGLISVKIKNAWYLGEARTFVPSSLETESTISYHVLVPAMITGICFGPVAADFINSKDWGLREEGQQSEITLVRFQHPTPDFANPSNLCDSGHHPHRYLSPARYRWLPASSQICLAETS